MLKLYATEALTECEASAKSFYNDEALINVSLSYDANCGRYLMRPLTLYRIEDENRGVMVGFEIRGGLLCGVEILGISIENARRLPDRGKRTLPSSLFFGGVCRFSFELDGRNTDLRSGILTLDQDAKIFVERYENSMVLLFDVKHYSLSFDGLEIYLNENMQVSGVCLNLFS